jgi:hypothetical protein
MQISTSVQGTVATTLGLLIARESGTRREEPQIVAEAPHPFLEEMREEERRLGIVTGPEEGVVWQDEPKLIRSDPFSFTVSERQSRWVYLDPMLNAAYQQQGVSRDQIQLAGQMFAPSENGLWFPVESGEDAASNYLDQTVTWDGEKFTWIAPEQPGIAQSEVTPTVQLQTEPQKAPVGSLSSVEPQTAIGAGPGDLGVFYMEGLEHIEASTKVDYAAWQRSDRQAIIEQAAELYNAYFPTPTTEEEWQSFFEAIWKAFAWVALAIAGGVIGNLAYAIFEPDLELAIEFAKSERRPFWKSLFRDFREMLRIAIKAARDGKGISVQDAVEQTSVKDKDKVKAWFKIFGGVHRHAGSDACKWFFRHVPGK